MIRHSPLPEIGPQVPVTWSGASPSCPPLATPGKPGPRQVALLPHLWGPPPYDPESHRESSGKPASWGCQPYSVWGLHSFSPHAPTVPTSLSPQQHPDRWGGPHGVLYPARPRPPLPVQSPISPHAPHTLSPPSSSPLHTLHRVSGPSISAKDPQTPLCSALPQSSCTRCCRWTLWAAPPSHAHPHVLCSHSWEVPAWRAG